MLFRRVLPPLRADVCDRSVAVLRSFDAVPAALPSPVTDPLLRSRDSFTRYAGTAMPFIVPLLHRRYTLPHCRSIVAMRLLRCCTRITVRCRYHHHIRVALPARCSRLLPRFAAIRIYRFLRYAIHYAVSRCDFARVYRTLW